MQERLKAEVLRVRGRFADAQVFEDTAGVSIGDPVYQSGDLLSVTLGPGLLGQVYDGLQNPLESLAVRHGTFLPRGVELPALDLTKKWSFVPWVQVGAGSRPAACSAASRRGVSAIRSWCPSISSARSR